jgi:murein DD-endopeptidase MepM/ murein hydrolase activator NlpD
VWHSPVGLPLLPHSAPVPPVGTFRITSPYGPRSDGFHAAIDIGNRRLGDPILATAAGRVLAVGFLTHPWSDPSPTWGTGNYGGLMVVLEHPGGLVSLYAHLARAEVVQGQSVAAGQRIGILGETGSALDRGHLHFSIGRGSAAGPTEWYDPAQLLEGDDMRMPSGFRRGPDNRQVTIAGRADRKVNVRNDANGELLTSVSSAVNLAIAGYIDATTGTPGRWWCGVLYIGGAATPRAPGVDQGLYLVAVHSSLCSEPVAIERVEVPDPELERAARAAVNVLEAALP